MPLKKPLMDASQSLNGAEATCQFVCVCGERCASVREGRLSFPGGACMLVESNLRGFPQVWLRKSGIYPHGLI